MTAGNRRTRWATALIFSIVAASAAIEAHTGGSIKVSGYWKIDVRNADGTLASHTEFENALTPPGGALLGKLLGGTATVRDLMVVLDGTHPCGKPCVIAPNNQDFPLFGLVYMGSNSATSDPALSMTLNVAGQTGASPKLVLGGLATTADGTINKVRTVVVVQCPADQALCDPTIKVPSGRTLPEIFAAISSTLTEFTLPDPGVTVTAGQVVSVSVTLTFSS